MLLRAIKQENAFNFMPETSGKAERKKQDRNYNVRVENTTLPQQNVK